MRRKEYGAGDVAVGEGVRFAPSSSSLTCQRRNFLYYEDGQVKDHNVPEELNLLGYLSS